MQNVCPLCNCIINDTDNRLVQESCGHKKCRNCFIQERLGCKLCQNEKNLIVPNKPEENHIQEQIEVGVVRNVKKYKGQLKLKTEWTILSETSSKLTTDEISTKDIYSTLKTDSTLLENTLVTEQNVDEDKLLHSHLSIDEAKTSETPRKTSKKKNHCTLKQRSKILLPSHIRIVKSKDRVLYECTICNSTFKFKYHYKYHESCPTGAKPFKCEYCDKTFKTLSHLRYHLKTHLETTRHCCKDCGKSFAQIGAFNRHIKIHAKSKSFNCNLCEEVFVTNASLSAHLFRHKNEKPFSCQICQKQFNDKSNLRKHVKSHEPENQKYLCDLCGKPFKLKWSLINHTLAHSRTKSHKCSKCNSVFADVNSLKRHHAIHLNYKPYSCEYCETKCRRKDNLERHIRNTHPENMKDQSDNFKRSYRKPIKKQIVPEMNVATAVANEETGLPENNAMFTNNIEQLCQRVDVDNTDPNINKSGTSNPHHPIQSFHEENFRIPVINGPIKLSLKNKEHSVKNMYRTANEKMCEDRHIDIYRKILQGPAAIQPNVDMRSSNECNKNLQQSTNLYYNSNMENKEMNQEYHIELYRKILMPSYVRDNKNPHIGSSLYQVNESKACDNANDHVEERISLNYPDNNNPGIKEPERTMLNNVESRLNYDNHVSTITMVSGNKIINSCLNDSDPSRTYL